jgi:hypothetical protein
MERAVWTDERLDDLSRRMDAGFERIDADIRELRLELRTDIGSLQSTILRVGGGMIATMLVGFLSVIAAVLTSA